MALIYEKQYLTNENLLHFHKCSLFSFLVKYGTILVLSHRLSEYFHPLGQTFIMDCFYRHPATSPQDFDGNYHQHFLKSLDHYTFCLIIELRHLGHAVETPITRQSYNAGKLVTGFNELFVDFPGFNYDVFVY